MIVIITIIAYFIVLLSVSKIKRAEDDNEVFFRANRRSPWYMVAFGMIGASISATSFVSVPGMVLSQDMTYLQMCLGFIVGYFVVAYVLLPLYYRLDTTTIYEWLQGRFGGRTHKTASLFFVVSGMASAAIGFYVVCSLVYEQLAAYPIPFAAVVLLLTLPIWLYTRRGGVRTLVFTDTIQTFCMLAAIVSLLFCVVGELGMTVDDVCRTVMNDSRSRVFVFDDLVSRQNFFKQFLSGVFIVIVMTGLNQYNMHKNLTCKSLTEAQKNMCTYGFAFVPVNALFLVIGLLLLVLYQRNGMVVEKGDSLLTAFCFGPKSSIWLSVLFTIGIVSAAFTSADSSMTALTTTYCVDIAGRKDNKALRQKAHMIICALFALFVVVFRQLNNTSLIDAIYTICSYTYGPLLGIFAYGMFTKRSVNDKVVPYIAVASPVLCYVINILTQRQYGYTFGYELLLLNGALTFLGMWVQGRKNRS